MRLDLFAVQPYMDWTDYLSEERFFRKVHSFFEMAQAQRSRQAEGLIVFPEEFATFLVIAGHDNLIPRARTTSQAFSLIGRSLIPQLIGIMLRYRTGSFKEAFFILKAPEVWRIWYHTMTRLANRYNITVVAGSALLPANQLGYNTPLFQAINHCVYNFSFTADNTGRVIYHTRKVNLVPSQEDTLPICPGPLDEAQSVTELPNSRVRLATAICYDGFRVPHTDNEPGFQSLVPLLDRSGVQILAQPSANPWPWDEPWVFEQPSPSPRTRFQQWKDESPESLLSMCQSIQVLINPQILMDFLDLHFTGQSRILARNDRSTRLLAQSRQSSGKNAEEVVHALWEIAPD